MNHLPKIVIIFFWSGGCDGNSRIVDEYIQTRHILLLPDGARGKKCGFFEMAQRTCNCCFANRRVAKISRRKGVMDWIQFLALLGSFTGLFFWSRSESRSDSRRIEDLITAIKDEIKDFHGRLCAIEERNRGK